MFPYGSHPGATENPFRRAFWLGQVDARPPALFRIGLGLLIAVDLCDRLRDFHAFYAPGGVLPIPGELLPGVLRLSLFSLCPSRGAVLALFLAGLPLALAFALGYRTRLASVLLWVFMLSLVNRNPLVCDGGDMVILSLLFWTMFTDTGAALSLDVRLGRRAPQATVPAIGLRMLQLQVALIYLVTFLAKTGPGWRHGEAVLHALACGDWGRGLAPLLIAHPGVCRALTRATLLFEGSFAFLVLSPFRPDLTRAVAIGCGLALHVGIFLTMRIGIFSEVMPLSYVVFLLPGWLDRWGVPRPAAPGPGRPRPRWLRIAVVGALGAQLALIVADQVMHPPRPPLPGLLGTELSLVAQRQNWHMFAPDAPVEDVSWRAPAQLGDGGALELTRVLIPELANHGGFIYSRWHRLRNTMATKRPDLLLPLGRYICRRWKGAHPETPLARFELVAVVHPVLSPAPPEEKVIFRQACTRTVEP
jgi:hypothetical protein